MKIQYSIPIIIISLIIIIFGSINIYKNIKHHPVGGSCSMSFSDSPKISCGKDCVYQLAKTKCKTIYSDGEEEIIE